MKKTCANASILKRSHDEISFENSYNVGGGEEKKAYPPGEIADCLRGLRKRLGGARVDELCALSPRPRRSQRGSFRRRS